MTPTRAVLAGTTLLATLLVPAALAQAPAKGPGIDDLISLKRVTSAEISPDGKLLAYTVRETNWDQNAYETSIWLADAESGVRWRLTGGKKSSTGPTWSPDGSLLVENFAEELRDRARPR